MDAGFGEDEIPRDTQPWRRIADGAVLAPLLAKGVWLSVAVAGFLLSGEVLRRRFALDTAQVGGALSVFGIGLGLGNLLVGRADRRLGSSEATLRAALALLAIAMSAFALVALADRADAAAPVVTATSLGSSLVSLCAWGVALGMAAPASAAILATRARADAGFVLALSESVNNACLLVAMPLAARLIA